MKFDYVNIREKFLPIVPLKLKEKTIGFNFTYLLILVQVKAYSMQIFVKFLGVNMED